MNPGPELDAKIATEVMGWVSADDGWWDLPDGKSTGYHQNDGLPAIGTEGDSDRWKPSEDIAAAWEAVEKVEHNIMFGRGNGFQPWASFTVPLSKHFPLGVAQGRAETMPHAICLALLKVVEAKTP